MSEREQETESGTPRTAGENPLEERLRALYAAAYPPSYPPVKPSEALRRRVAEVTAQCDTAAARPVARRLITPVGWWPALAGVAVVLLVVALGFGLVRWGHDPAKEPGAPSVVRQLPTDPSIPTPRSALRFPGKSDASRLAQRRLIGRARLRPSRVPETAVITAARPEPRPPRRRIGSAELSGVGHRPPVGDELTAINGDALGGGRLWAPRTKDAWDEIEARVRRTLRMRDNFVAIPLPRLALGNPTPSPTPTGRGEPDSGRLPSPRGGGVLAAAVESYEREAAVVDARLSREVTLAFKATALSDVCDRLRAETGIHLEAGRSVADEKVTVFCDKMALREVMRQLARPFGYTWLRSGTAPSPPHSGGEQGYRYELVQDLRSQLLEEELRNRDRNGALLGLSKEMERYRPYLGLSPDQALERSRTAPPAEKKLLETLGGWGWGPIQMYFRLTPQELTALRAGQTLTFSQEPKAGESPLPPEMARGVLECLRDVRVIRRDSGYDFAPRPDPLTGADGGSISLTAVPEARAGVKLSLNQSKESELGRLTLDGSSRFVTGTRFGGGFSKAPYAVGMSGAVVDPQNALANARFARDHALQARVTVRPVGSGQWAVGSSEHPALPAEVPTPQHRNTATPDRKVTTADVLEALHRATGMPIVADFYTRLYAPRDVTVGGPVALFEALNQLADRMRMRWTRDGNWLQLRSVSFYDDRIKEVPNRLLARWANRRRERGELALDDLIEIAGLSVAQLDAADMAEGAREWWGLAEWDLARPRSARSHWRFLAQLTPGQREEAQSAAGLAFTRMSLAQQQQFLAVSLAAQSDPPPSLQDLSEAVLRAVYTRPGGFEWPGTGHPTILQFRPSPVRERTREAALQGARRLDAQVEATQIVPTSLALTILYRCGAGPDAYVHVLRIGPKGATGYDGRPSRR